MDMYAQRGSKVIFTGQGGRDSDKEFANKYLKVGEVYTVKTTKVFDWISFVVLEELPSKDFNTVMFEDLEDDEKLCEEIEQRILNDNGKRFTSEEAIKMREANKFYEAYNFLNEHDIFKLKYKLKDGTPVDVNKFYRCLETDVVKVNPETMAIDDDESKNTLVQVWLECGPWDEEDNIPCHDYDLDCYGNTFEEAVIELAKLVKEKYGE